MSEEQKKKNTMNVSNPKYAEMKLRNARNEKKQVEKEPEYSMIEGKVVLYQVSDKGGLTRV